MQNAGERRGQGAVRIGIDTAVEVGGAGLPTFTASAVDLSRGGAHLIAPFLPELGQTLSCRLRVGEHELACEGVVVWHRAGSEAHDFGVRFTSLDADSADALRTLLPSVGAEAVLSPGQRIRLHIDGLGAPMRARVRQADAGGLQAQSELGFLQIGRPLDIEDAKSGERLCAQIEHVGVELDPATNMPQLIVRLAYAAAPAHEGPDTERQPPIVASAPLLEAAPALARHDAEPEAHSVDSAMDAVDPAMDAVDPAMEAVAAAGLPQFDEADAALPASARADELSAPLDEEPLGVAAREAAMIAATAQVAAAPSLAERSAVQLRHALGEAYGNVKPLLARMQKSAQQTSKSLIARLRQTQTPVPADVAPARRTTAKAPARASNDSMRLRGQRSQAAAAVSEPLAEAASAATAVQWLKANPRKVVLGTVSAVAALLVGIAFGSSATEPDAMLAEGAPLELPAATVAELPAMESEPAAPALVETPPRTPARGVQRVLPSQPPSRIDDLAVGNEELETVDDTPPVVARAKKDARPFGRGKIEAGKAFLLKMDGPIEELQGAALPDGFSITLPERRSLEAASALFKQDPRVESAKVLNTSHGAELEVHFKDGVPGYAVRARGEILEVVLSRPELAAERQAAKLAAEGKGNQAARSTAQGTTRAGQGDGGGIQRASVTTGGRSRPR